MALLNPTLANALLDHYFNNATYTPLGTYHVSLHTASPGTNGANEATGTGYARVSTVAADWDPAASGSIDNGNVVQFPTPGAGGWGTVTHFGIWSAASGVTYQFGGALAVSKAINQDDDVEFAAGALVTSLS